MNSQINNRLNNEPGAKPKTLSAKDIIKMHLVGGLSNEKLIKYGKISRNLAYELTRNNGPYLNGMKYHLRFVELNPLTSEAINRADLDMYEKDFTEVENHIKSLKNRIILRA